MTKAIYIMHNVKTNFLCAGAYIMSLTKFSGGTRLSARLYVAVAISSQMII